MYPIQRNNLYRVSSAPAILDLYKSKGYKLLNIVHISNGFYVIRPISEVAKKRFREAAEQNEKCEVFNFVHVANGFYRIRAITEMEGERFKKT